MSRVNVEQKLLAEPAQASLVERASLVEWALQAEQASLAEQALLVARELAESALQAFSPLLVAQVFVGIFDPRRLLRNPTPESSTRHHIPDKAISFQQIPRKRETIGRIDISLEFPVPNRRPVALATRIAVALFLP